MTTVKTETKTEPKKMVRRYVRTSNRAEWPEECMVDALNAVLCKALTPNAASNIFAVPYSTLKRRLRAAIKNGGQIAGPVKGPLGPSKEQRAQIRARKLAELEAKGIPIPTTKKKKKNSPSASTSNTIPTPENVDATDKILLPSTSQVQDPSSTSAPVSTTVLPKSEPAEVEDNFQDLYPEIKADPMREKTRFDLVGQIWADKLKALPDNRQRIWAEKLISDVFCEAELGRLGDGCKVLVTSD